MSADTQETISMTAAMHDEQDPGLFTFASIQCKIQLGYIYYKEPWAFTNRDWEYSGLDSL